MATPHLPNTNPQFSSNFLFIQFKSDISQLNRWKEITKHLLDLLFPYPVCWVPPSLTHTYAPGWQKTQCTSGGRSLVQLLYLHLLRSIYSPVHSFVQLFIHSCGPPVGPLNAVNWKYSVIHSLYEMNEGKNDISWRNWLCIMRPVHTMNDMHINVRTSRR